MSIVVCPKCKSQLEVRLLFASEPKSANPVSTIGSLLDEAESHTLNDWQANFIEQTRERYNQYGESTRMSEKQMSVLEKIARGE